jgi:hypothetical protein
VRHAIRISSAIAVVGVHRQPGDLILKRPGEARVVPGPRHRRDHHPVLFAAHPRRPRLQERERRAEIQRPPPPAALSPQS